MFERKPRWMSFNSYTINLDKVTNFCQRADGVVVVFDSGTPSLLLREMTLSQIDYFLKYGKPKKRKP